VNVLGYGFEESEINYFRFREPMQAIQKQGLAEVRTTASQTFPKLMPNQRLAGLQPEDWKPDEEEYRRIWREIASAPLQERERIAKAWSMRPVFVGTSLEDAQSNEAACKADLQWADILFTQRYVNSDCVRGLGPLVDAAGVPHVLDIDDHILALDPEKTVAKEYGMKHPSEWGETRKIESPKDAKPGEVVMENPVTKELLAVVPKKDYVRGLTDHQVLDADALICGTRQMSYIYKNYRKKNGKSGRVFYIPYSVNPARWQGLPAKPDHGNEVWIGWLGADEHEKDLVAILPVIKHALATHKHVRFFWKRNNVRKLEEMTAQYPERCVKFVQWVSHEQWPTYCALSGFDIMLAPLVSTAFNECRSPMKWIEAAMLKTPCICAPRWGYREVVENGKTGFLCERPNQWIKALEKLIGSRQLREDIGSAAQAKALEKHDVNKNASMYIDAFERTLRCATTTH
jgi:glycosyltransferase involved in cell wall biosynthesis